MVSGDVLKLSYHFVCVCVSVFFFVCPIICQFIWKWAFFSQKNGAIFVFCQISLMLERERKNIWKISFLENAKRHNKTGVSPHSFVFYLLSSKDEEKSKKKDTGLSAKLAWHYICREERKTRRFVTHYLFWPKMLWPKQCKPRSTIFIGVSGGVCFLAKNDTFFVKEGEILDPHQTKLVWLTVFLKSSVLGIVF